METLTEYTRRNFIKPTESKFNKYVSESEDILNICGRIKQLGIEDIMHQYFDDLVRIAKYRPKEFFIYSDSKPYFKIPYVFFDSILQLESEYPQLSLDPKGIKIKVSYKGKKIFETGSGSVGRVSTEQQEMATCIVWNSVYNGININDAVYRIEGEFDSEWRETFKKQVEVISKYLKSFGLNPSDYRLVRFGQDELGKMYKKFITAYTKQISGKKDNHDPSDVLLYSVKDLNNIIDELKSYKCKDIDDTIECKRKFTQNLFITHKLIGLSLKKIPGNKQGVFETFNIGEDRIAQVNSFKLFSISKKQIILHCDGKFDLGGESKPTIKLVMRSFGEGIVAVDAAILSKKEPALGKCAVKIWRADLNLSQKDTLETCIDAFKYYIENNSNAVNDLLTRWIKSSIKEGPNCFPFVLIH